MITITQTEHNVWMKCDETDRLVGQGAYATVEEAEAEKALLLNEPMYWEMSEFRNGIYGGISDASKEVMGVRYRLDISLMTTNELIEEYDKWCARIVEELEYEERAKQREAEEQERWIQQAMAMGAPNRRAAKRWMAQA
jgi:hypothetical protein